MSDDDATPEDETEEVAPEPSEPVVVARAESYLPGWVFRAILLFWVGYLVVLALQAMWGRLSSFVLLVVIALFLAFAIEPGVNRLHRRGLTRGQATAAIMFGVGTILVLFVGAIGTLVASQLVDLLNNSETYITDTVDTINGWFGTSLDAQQVINEFNRDDGAVQEFIDAQSDNVVALSVQAINGVVQALSVLLFTYYLVADGPRLRRAICSRLRPDLQLEVLRAWELAITKTGGYLYSRALLALLSAAFHWVVFTIVGTDAPIPLALFVGAVSQFLPVVGTYIAGILPVLITFLDSPASALVVLVAILLYQQVENYIFSPRITARTMELHPAVAFGAALVGILLLGVAGAILALPAAAMVQALSSQWGTQYDVIDNDLTLMDYREPE